MRANSSSSDKGQSAIDSPNPVSLLHAWWETVGAGLARVASPRGIEEGRLRVAVRDRAWEREVRAHSAEILASLRAKKGLERLLGIDLVIDDSPPLFQARSQDPSRPEDREVPAEILEAARSITDSGLSDRWVRAVGRLLSRAKVWPPPEHG